MEQEPVAALILSQKVIQEANTRNLSLINCFEEFILPSVPFQVDAFFVTAHVTHLHGKPEKLNVTVRIEQAESGHVLASTTLTFRLPANAPSFDPRLVYQFPIPFPRFTIPSAGDHVARLLLNNEEIGHRLLPVKLAAMPVEPELPGGRL